MSKTVVSNLLSFTFVCSLPNGIHARPASHLAEVANAFTSECILTNERNNAIANLKSVLAIIAAEIRNGDRCSVQLNGPDQQSAHAALQQFIVEVLPGCDVPPAGGNSFIQGRTLPRVLQAAGVAGCFGLSVSQGFAHGEVVIVSAMMLPRSTQALPALSPPQEQERLKRALSTVRSRIREKLTHPTSPTARAILQAHLAIAGDVSLTGKVAEKISQGASVAQAIIEAAEFFMSRLHQSESEYTRERASDVQEICLQLLDEIYADEAHGNEIRGAELHVPAVELRGPSVIVAETLTPQQLLSLDRRHLKAIVLEHSGTTSHAVILARSLGIPVLVGVKNACAMFSPGQEVVVDANRGLVVANRAASVQKFYRREAKTLERRRQLMIKYSDSPAVTSDGKTLQVAANASSYEETAQAFANGADAIGLFRTEILFLGHETPPSEDEQFAVYAEAARAAAGRPVIIRTFDIGADKPAPYLTLASEDNPFLGYRGVRLYAEHKELLQSQLRAILRASSQGRIQIMVPMVSSMEEVVAFKTALAEARQSLAATGPALQADAPIGIMIEVPSAALILDQLCAEVDFCSIGTNDLSQYFFAADRGNARVAELANVRHPAFLRFLKQTVDQIRLAGKWVGMCGEMASDIRNLPLLLGLGLDEISLPSAQIPEFKRKVSGLRTAECNAILNRVIACTNAVEVDNILNCDPALHAAQPLLTGELLLLESASQSKEEAIQEIVDAFYVAGRTDDRHKLEESIWSREAAYSTGLGYEFAAPHCKTDAVTSDSIAVLRLKQPIEWGSVDGKPVRMIVLMALRNQGSAARHLQIFAILARKLMDDDFRAHLLAIKTANEIVTYLTEQLG